MGESRPRAALADIWRILGGPTEALEHVAIDGADPVLPSIYRIGAAAGSTVAAAGLAAATFEHTRSGRWPRVEVDTRSAAVAFRGERYLRIDGAPPPALWDPTAGYYRTGDGGFIQLHTNFPHHRDRAAAVLDAAPERSEFEAAIGARDRFELEAALVANGACAAALRSHAEWALEPQSAAVAALPLLEVTRIGDAPVERPAATARILGGIRVLDLTRVLAGPVCGRTLAELGADVIRIAAPHLPSVAPLVVDTGRGKRSSFVDLRDPAGRETLRNLVRETDVFVQGYRPGAIARHGFDPASIAALRPGAVCVNLCAFSHEGPWSKRRGFDSLVQTASGIAHAGGVAAGIEGPGPLPCQALDYATGYLAAAGVAIALCRRATEGGSWQVRLSLAQTGRWLQSLGEVNGLDCADPDLGAVEDLLESRASPFGRLRHVRCPIGLDGAPLRAHRAAAPLGSHPPRW